MIQPAQQPLVATIAIAIVIITIIVINN